MKKILIFSLAYYPKPVGGAEIAIKEISKRIPVDEIEFDMVTFHFNKNDPKFERIGNVNIYRIGYFDKYSFIPLCLFNALSLHKKNKYDAIWSMMASYNSFAALFFKIINPKVPYILTLQEGDPIEHMERRALPLYPLFKMIFTKADHIQAISNFLADWARKMGAKCPVEVIPNGVDFNLFSIKKSHADLEILKRNLGKKVDDIFLITTSRLVLKNATGDTIEALQYLPANVKFLILGVGHLEGELKEKVARLGLEERVRFVGFVDHSEMPQYLHISDIFIRPALSEGFGISYVEAMAAGIPVIATPVGGIVDFVKDGETGLLCEVNNPQSIAQKVEKLVKDKESYDYIVNNAESMVKNKYDWDIVARDMKNKVFLR